jgi:hypothetical protein
MERFFRLGVLVVTLVFLVLGCNQTDRPASPVAPDVGIFACEYGCQGCTPGYWKNVRMHGCYWMGYSPDDDFDTVFGVDMFDPDLTLLEALNNGGGGYNALGRHAVAALLNARANIGFGFLEGEVINSVQLAVANGDPECYKDQLEKCNESYCPLNNCK